MMAIPTLNINITANIVAAYAAVVSTITGAMQMYSHLRDRAHLRIHVHHNMVLVGAGERYAGKKFTIVYVTNVGRRPVTVTSVCASQRHPLPNIYVPDSQPLTHCELTEGKQLRAMFDPSGLDLSQIESYEAYFLVSSLVI